MLNVFKMLQVPWHGRNIARFIQILTWWKRWRRMLIVCRLSRSCLDCRINLWFRQKVLFHLLWHTQGHVFSLGKTQHRPVSLNTLLVKAVKCEDKVLGVSRGNCGWYKTQNKFRAPCKSIVTILTNKILSFDPSIENTVRGSLHERQSFGWFDLGSGCVCSTWHLPAGLNSSVSRKLWPFKRC